jgi:hypothetical protein
MRWVCPEMYSFSLHRDQLLRLVIIAGCKPAIERGGHFIAVLPGTQLCWVVHVPSLPSAPERITHGAAVVRKSAIGVPSRYPAIYSCLSA